MRTVYRRGGRIIGSQEGLYTEAPDGLPCEVEHVITADDVRAEASRRMQALVGARDERDLERKIVNGNREATRLLRIKADRAWSTEEAMRAAALEAVDAAIEAIRAASNAIEATPPADYADDRHWPAQG